MPRLESDLENYPLSKKIEKPTSRSHLAKMSDVAGQPIIGQNRKAAIDTFDEESESLNREPRIATPSRHESSSALGEMLINAKTLMESSEFIDAEHLLVQIVEANPTHFVALAWLAECYKNRKVFSSAADIYLFLRSQHPRIEIELELASCFYELGRFDEALECYFEALENFEFESPLLFEVYKNIGNIHVRTGNLPEAEEYFNKAYTLNPDSDILLVNYGTLEIQKGQLDQAKEFFRQAVKQNAENDKAWVGLALIHREFSDHSLAVGNALRALDINIENETALNLVVNWSVKDDNLDPALLMLERLLKIKTNEISLQMLNAKLLYCGNRLQEAEMEIEKVVQVDAQYPGAAYLAEAIQTEKKKLLEGLECLKK